MLFMIRWRRLSTSSRVQGIRMLFWAISSPETATPPALAAFPGPYRIPASRKSRTPSKWVGMLAPSATT